ncbi:putative mitochondrial ATPase inhibitor [Astrocystis sublimbata]|nr:putative mitochondrial ATPase inhibitor [Astrocystis sublimbata]KAI0186729.1 putative mitochondrial ATPase inhibitor [Astrocystis sublimbata]
MFRQTLIKLPTRGVSTRAFSTTVRAMAAGDTGSPPKTGGQGDAFQQRERANEDYAIRRREQEKLLELRKKINEQQDHLKKLSDHIDELTKEQGGEKN